MGNESSSSVQENLYNEKDYAQVNQIADPHYGQVNILKNNQTGQFVCEITKTINREDIFDQVVQQSNFRKTLQNEGIIKMINFSVYRHEEFCSTFWRISLLYEYFNYDLQSCIDEKIRQSQHFSEGELWYIIYQCINTLGYLKQKGIINGDIRPFTLLISSEGKIRLSENFQENKILTAYQKLIADIQKETPHISPELFKAVKTREKNPQVDYSKNDIYSLGLTVLEAAILKNPVKIYDFENFEVLDSELRLMLDEVLKFYSPQLKEILELMLTHEESNRPDLEIMLQHLERRYNEEEFRGSLVDHINLTPEDQHLQGERVKRTKFEGKQDDEADVNNLQVDQQNEQQNDKQPQPEEFQQQQEQQQQPQEQQLPVDENQNQFNNQEDQQQQQIQPQDEPQQNQNFDNNAREQEVPNTQNQYQANQPYSYQFNQQPTYQSPPKNNNAFTYNSPPQSQLPAYNNQIAPGQLPPNYQIKNQQSNKDYEDLDARIQAVLQMSRETVMKYGGPKAMEIYKQNYDSTNDPLLKNYMSNQPTYNYQSNYQTQTPVQVQTQQYPLQQQQQFNDNLVTSYIPPPNTVISNSNDPILNNQQYRIISTQTIVQPPQNQQTQNFQYQPQGQTYALSQSYQQPIQSNTIMVDQDLNEQIRRSMQRSKEIEQLLKSQKKPVYNKL